MTSIKKLSVCFIVFQTVIGFGQDEKTKNCSINEAQLFSGMNIYSVQQLTLTEMNPFAPNSSILAKDYSGFNSSAYKTIYSNQSFSALIGIGFKEQPNYLIRVGVNYSSKTNFIGSAGRMDSYAYDTLTSSQTGEQFYLDSVVYKSVDFNQSVEQFSLDASFLFRTNPEKRWSLQGGIGFMLGTSLNSITHLSYYQWTSTPNEMFTNQKNEYEQFRNKNYLTTSLFLPLGIDFRIGNKREFWKLIHLFYEARPSVGISVIPESSTQTQFYLAQGIGLKIKW